MRLELRFVSYYDIETLNYCLSADSENNMSKKHTDSKKAYLQGFDDMMKEVFIK